jgi:hypothetical protein
VTRIDKSNSAIDVSGPGNPIARPGRSASEIADDKEAEFRIRNLESRIALNFAPFVNFCLKSVSEDPYTPTALQILAQAAFEA